MDLIAFFQACTRRYFSSSQSSVDLFTDALMASWYTHHQAVAYLRQLRPPAWKLHVQGRQQRYNSMRAHTTTISIRTVILLHRLLSHLHSQIVTCPSYHLELSWHGQLVIQELQVISHQQMVSMALWEFRSWTHQLQAH